MTKELYTPPENDKQDIKEEFCGACMAVPLAFAGAGSSGAGSQMSGGKKTALIVVGVILTLISIWLAWKFMFGCKTCPGKNK
jgi:hypothetical protein